MNVMQTLDPTTINLNRIQRIVFCMEYADGLNTSEMALALNTSVSHIERIRHSIKRALNKQC